MKKGAYAPFFVLQIILEDVIIKLLYLRII